MDRYVPLPPLPPRIARLNELAYDLSWSWHPQAREVFRDLDYPLWRFTDHNPVLLLHLVEPERLAHAASDPDFLRLYDAAVAGLDLVRAGAGTWWAGRAPGANAVAFITPRVALHQSLPIETDGAGVMAAECFKEASDLGIPLIGIALMYPRGYAHQRLSAEGWQQDAYEYIDWSDAPIRPALRADGQRCDLRVNVGTGEVHVAVWLVRAGRVTLYLLDTDVDGNMAWDRELASGSFLGDPDMRARQAALLGAGALAALDALAIEPAVWHLSEGLATFVSLERINQLVSRGVTLDDALAQVRGSTVYATREPDHSRRDAFSFATLDRHLGSAWAALAAFRAPLLQLGHFETGRGAAFHPSVFGAATSGTLVVPEPAAPGERVARPDPGAPDRSPRVRTVPEGIHLPSWVSSDLAALFEDAVGADWRERQDDLVAWEALRHVPDALLWDVRERLRGFLIEFMRTRARRCWSRERASGAHLVALGTLLDPSALTIGYAQPFEAGRGPELLFTDPTRLAQILTAPRRPVQFVFAGRAHPADDAGKHHLQRLFRHALDPAFGGRLAFLEDYDLHVARLLVQGCDVWLGTPRRGAPALIGGIQAAVNGAPHLGTRDAWWPDGWTGNNGWVVEGGIAGDGAARETAEARAIYQLLEDRIVPGFYDRGRGGVPLRWLPIVKEAIVSAVPRFCARRMMKVFADGLYGHPAVNRVVEEAR